AVDAEPRTVLITMISDPPGATVSIDSFVLAGTTPIADAPVTARSGRIFTVALDGFQTLEQAVDLLEDQTINVTLAPVAAAAVSAAGGEPQAVAGTGELVIAVRASTWLEVYRGTARNQGERLVYRTADPGETFRFDLPVYVHVGNAAGVDVTVGDVQVGALGSSGAVVGRAFTGP
ncbi:MAG TPA: RodZ domain-containing protein, partial [Trueperaceae bacterium]|nr:RodZ domain-containing protein [Trueperaceae bacterium]